MLPIKITNRPLPLSLHVSLHLFRAVSLADTRFKRKSILIRRPTSVHPSIRSRKYRTRRVHYHTRREGGRWGKGRRRWEFNFRRQRGACARVRGGGVKGRNDRGSGSGVGGCGERRWGGGGFKKNEITDWVAANWPASNQSLARWMREYIMYIPSLPSALYPWNHRCIPHSKSYFPVTWRGKGER